MLASYTYDTLNRPTGVSYNVGTSGVPATPSVTLTYGTSAASFNNGKVITLTDGPGSESYAYDQFGNVTQLAKVISGTTYTTGYAYNFANQLIQINYPSGRVVQQNMDSIGRISSVVGTINGVPTTYTSGFAYSAAQHALGFSYANGIKMAAGYSADRLQRTCLDYSTTTRSSCTHDATTRFGLGFSYGSVGNNNGQITSITDSVDNGRSASYSYDALYRITSALTTGSSAYPQWGLSWTYDRYGNRSAQTVTAGSGYGNSLIIDATKNRVTETPYAYDLNGNMTSDGVNTLSWDAENRAVTAASGSNTGTYTYDGNSLRVKKVSTVGVTTTTVYLFSGSRVIAEYDNGAAPTNPTREYIYSGSIRIAQIDSLGTKYYHQDHVSNRLVTDSSGNTVAEMGSYPFGESWYNALNNKWVFTSYERDSESNNDYAQARYYINRLGRFSSPDVHEGTTGNPQSLNRYAYVLNDPLSFVDPLGLDPTCSGGSLCGILACVSSASCQSSTNGGYGIFPLNYGDTLGAPGVGTSHVAEEMGRYETDTVGLTFEYRNGRYHKSFDSWLDYTEWLSACGGNVECDPNDSDGEASGSLAPIPQRMSFDQILATTVHYNMSFAPDKTIACIAWVESSGNTVNKPPEGSARGLMSVNKATATAVYQQYSDNPSFAGFTAKSLHTQQTNPAVSIMTGSAYFQMIAFDVYHRGVPGAISAYRFGPSSRRTATKYTQAVNRCINQ